jgi:SpoVK/Ycf46/Vps4 family AAA+-type ATPase
VKAKAVAISAIEAKLRLNNGKYVLSKLSEENEKRYSQTSKTARNQSPVEDDDRGLGPVKSNVEEEACYKTSLEESRVLASCSSCWYVVRSFAIVHERTFVIPAFKYSTESVAPVSRSTGWPFPICKAFN